MDRTTLLEKIKNKAVFTIKDIERIAYCNNFYAKQIIHRLKRKGFIKQITRNAYTTKTNIFVIGSNITYPCYISFWAASSYLGYTEQILNTIQIATTRRVKNIVFEQYTIKFVPMKYFFGYKKENTDEGEVFIADNEKLLIDCFLHPKECGNFDEIEKIYKNTEIKKEKIIEYLKRIKKQTIIKKVGYLLEREKALDISYAFILDNNYVTLNPFAKKGKKIIPKWRVKL